MSDKPTKQVIILRRDLKMSVGKALSQACHSSVGAFLERITYKTRGSISILINDEIYSWLESGQTKVVLGCEDEKQLLELHAKAKAAFLPHSLIVDEGRTEFNGVATTTALSIGPAYSDVLNEITGKLSLY